MKNTVILLALISITAYSQRCNNPISRTAAEIAIQKAQVNPEVEFPQNFKCNAQSECLCYDGIEWKAAEIVPNMIDDKPIYDKKEVLQCDPTCKGEEEFSCNSECDEKLLELREVCVDEEYPPVKFEGEVFCGMLTGYTQVQDGNKIVNNEQLNQQVVLDRAAAAQREEARANKIRQNRQDLMSVGQQIDNANSVRDLKPVLEKIVEVLGIELEEK